jgi:hypothetical protein
MKDEEKGDGFGAGRDCAREVGGDFAVLEAEGFAFV